MKYCIDQPGSLGDIFFSIKIAEELSKKGEVFWYIAPCFWESGVSRIKVSDNVHIGPSDFVPWLNDRKWAYIRIEGEGFGGTPLNMELKLEVWDSPNSAGVVTDAVRCCKVAIDRGLKGAILGPAAYFTKSPPIQYSDNEAKIMVDEFVVEETS
mgnify:CR=1 FL=1